MDGSESAIRKILVTGASGYVGSFTTLKLLEAGFDVVGVDNFENSKKTSLTKVENLAGKAISGFYEVDVTELNALVKVFALEKPDAVIHFAGLKNTRESLEHPGAYYSNNVKGTINVLHAMDLTRCKKIVFSSSCTVYNPDSEMPFSEDNDLGPVTPYGRSKMIAEQIITDICNANEETGAVLLRYFNPVGAHPSGVIGEDPKQVTNLFPILLEVIDGKRDQLEIFGNDWNTLDGTCVRDYIHVLDVAEAHVKALTHITNEVQTFNIGTGNGVSILELVYEFQDITGEEIPYKIGEAKAGDVASAYCDPSRAQEKLDWSAKRSLKNMIQDAYAWKKLNPKGYDDE